MTLRLAVVVSHPIQHFAPWHRAVAKLEDVNLKVFFCCDWGLGDYFDPEFGTEFKWDTPLLDGYPHEFLPIKSRPKLLNYWSVDNPSVNSALLAFNPDVVQLFGYAYRTNWRVAAWARKNKVPILLYSDSALTTNIPPLKRFAKDAVVGRFYTKVDGALFVGDNNRAYHSRYGIPDERLFEGSLPIDYEHLKSSVSDQKFTRLEVRRRHGIPDNAFVVLFCGKLTERKRPLDVVQATHYAGLNHPELWCLLVGEGESRETIQRFVSQNDSRAVLAGFVNQSSIAQYYVASDVLVVSSEFDPHPLVVTEAAAFGLPAIVSSNVGCIGPNDTVRPELNALVYNCGDVSGLVAAVVRLRDDRVTYNQMSRAAEEIGRSQAAPVAAAQLASAVRKLHALGQASSRVRLNQKLKAIDHDSA